MLRAPGSLLDGLVLQLALGPALALAASRVLQLSPAYTLGLCLVGCCPGASAAAAAASLAGANVALSVAMTTGACEISVHGGSKHPAA